MSVGEFWGLTPWLLVEVIRAESDRAADARALAGWQAWHTAACGRTVKMPPLSALIGAPESGDGGGGDGLSGPDLMAKMSARLGAR